MVFASVTLPASLQKAQPSRSWFVLTFSCFNFFFFLSMDFLEAMFVFSGKKIND
jgi:hypothetical protein